MASGVVTGDAAIGTDTLRSIESIRGTNFADTYVATGFGSSGTNIGSFGTFNEIEGLGGNDQITGNGNTRIAFYNALDGVTVDLAAGTSHGTAANDVANVGTDTFTLVNAVRGSNFADTILGDANANTLEGRGGNDLIDGRGGADTLIGGTGADTFVYAKGYGATTISDFDQGNGAFNQAEGDQLQLTGFTGQPTITNVGGNTIEDFGNGDVLTLLNVNLQPSITGDLSVLTVKGSGVQLTGLATATTTADLQALDPGFTPDQLTFTVTATSHGHLATSATGPAITSFTQAQLNNGSVFFVADSLNADGTPYVGQGSFTVTLSDGVVATPPTTVGVTIVDAQLSVLTPGGYNFDQDNSIGAMGSAPISPGGTSTTFTIINVAANRDFFFVGSGFQYDRSQSCSSPARSPRSWRRPMTPAIRRWQASTSTCDAAAWMNGRHRQGERRPEPDRGADQSLDLQFRRQCRRRQLRRLGYVNDIFTGRAGNDTFDGQFGYDRANYGAATGRDQRPACRRHRDRRMPPSAPIRCSRSKW